MQIIRERFFNGTLRQPTIFRYAKLETAKDAILAARQAADTTGTSPITGQPGLTLGTFGFATVGDDLAGFDLTAAMDLLTPRQLAGLEADEPTPQRALAVREWERRGVEYEPWPGE